MESIPKIEILKRALLKKSQFWKFDPKILKDSKIIQSEIKYSKLLPQLEKYFGATK